MKLLTPRPTTQPRSGPRRWQYILSGLVVLVAAAGFALVTGRTAPKIMLGRNWPASDRVALDRISHEAWDVLVQRYVDSAGGVDYAHWQASIADVATLDEYLAELSRADPASAAPRAAQLAFWINAYNAVTIRGILREYPTSSIQNHVSWLGRYNIWRDLLLIVGPRTYSLGQIEHDILRPLNEPRIHFAIVCASRGCPRLRDRAYTPSNLEAQLQENAIAFFSDPSKLDFDSATGRLKLSPILKWYAADFGTTPTERLQKIAAYMPDGVARELSARRDMQIEYLDYDWRLNEQIRLSSDPPLAPLDPSAEIE
jgi:hypothetical protein